MKSYTWMTLTTVFFTVASVCASPPWSVRTWQSDEGLPDNTVMGIEQTSDNFLWVATHTGLTRFDGLQFREFPVQAFGVPSGAIHALLVDRHGRLWVAKGKGSVICVEQGVSKVVLAPVNEERAGKYSFYNAGVTNFTRLKVSGQATFLDNLGITPNQPGMKGMPSLILLR